MPCGAVPGEGEEVGVDLVPVRDEEAVRGALVLPVRAGWDEGGRAPAGQGRDAVLVGVPVNDRRPRE